MQAKIKVCALTAAVFLTLLFALIPQASCAGSITLTPNAQAPGASVTVSGSGFGATKALGVGFGAEVTVTGESVNLMGSGLGPYTINFAGKPIKPGTFILNFNISDGLTFFNYTENGNGVVSCTASSFANGTVNYATGQLVYFTTIDPAGFTVVRKGFYTRYQNDVTPVANITTSASGAFSANFTVPAVANGNYNVTVIDASGNVAVAALNVNSAIPEVLPFGAILLLSTVAVIAGSWHFRKRPKIPMAKL